MKIIGSLLSRFMLGARYITVSVPQKRKFAPLMLVSSTAVVLQFSQVLVQQTTWQRGYESATNLHLILFLQTVALVIRGLGGA